MATNSNIILLTDSYKVSHFPQYPPGTTHVYSYFESRGGAHPYTTFFGLQQLLMDHFCQPLFMGDVEEAEQVLAAHLGPGLFNKAGWTHIVRDHNGYLPLLIKAVPEGMSVPTHNVLMTVENTCPQCYWLTNYVETLLVQTWYPTTVCTQSRIIKELIGRFMDLTAGHRDGLEFKLHDFGFRGVSSVESAGIGGCAHLVNFKGTDTIPALQVAKRVYGEPMAGFSIPAAEHSTITSWGRDHEAQAYRNMLDMYPQSLLAVVSDSYDIFNACENIWGGQLKNEVMARNGTLVIRPDSGDPVEVVTRVMEILGEKFGHRNNRAGYKVLPDQVRVIQGDGVNYRSINDILIRLTAKGWSTENIAFGMGGALLQQLHRDTQRFAFKCAAMRGDNGPWRDVYKKPATDLTKQSKAGRMKLTRVDSALTTRPESFPCRDELVVAYQNGHLMNKQTLAEIRQRAK